MPFKSYRCLGVGFLGRSWVCLGWRHEWLPRFDECTSDMPASGSAGENKQHVSFGFYVFYAFYVFYVFDVFVVVAMQK